MRKNNVLLRQQLFPVSLRRKKYILKSLSCKKSANKYIYFYNLLNILFYVECLPTYNYKIIQGKLSLKQNIMSVQF